MAETVSTRSHPPHMAPGPERSWIVAAIRNGKVPVLLVVDVQNGALAGAHEREQVIANIGVVLAKAREKNAPIVWIQHADDELPTGSEAWQIVSGLRIGNGDYRVDKRYNSSFEETELDDILERLGATELVIVGAATNWCVRATAYGALDRGYDVTLISDAHTTESMVLRDGRTIEARDIITDLNAAMAFLRYPGRRNQAKKAAEYSF